MRKFKYSPIVFVLALMLAVVSYGFAATNTVPESYAGEGDGEGAFQFQGEMWENKGGGAEREQGDETKSSANQSRATEAVRARSR